MKQNNKQFGVGLESLMCIMSQMQTRFTPVTFLSGEVLGEATFQ